VIDSAPQVMGLAIDLHEALIDMPPPLSEALHPADPLAPDVGCKHRSEAIPPEPHGLIADVDSALCEQILYIPKRQRKPHI